MKKILTLKNQNGFTMLEVLVAMTLGLVVLGSAIGMQVSHRKGFKITESKLNMQTNARFAFEFMGSSLRELGAIGCRTVENYYDSESEDQSSNYEIGFVNDDIAYADFRLGNELVGYDNLEGSTTWQPIVPVAFDYSADLIDGSDAITIRGAIGPTYAVDVENGDYSSTGVQLNMANVSNVQLGPEQYAVMSQCDKAEVFQITSTQAQVDAGTIVHGVSGLAVSNEAAFFSKDFDERSIAELRRVAVTSYYIANNDNGIPTLYRDRDNTSDPLVEGVERMQIEYGVNSDRNSEGGTVNVPDEYHNAVWVDASAGGWANVMAVRLSFIMRSKEEVFKTDVTKTYRLPGTTVYSYTPTDKYARLIYTATVNLRNRTLGKRTQAADNMYSNKHNNIKLQGGVVLVTSLVLMAILTVIGVAAMRSNMMDVNIHKNMQSRSNAFQCAEAALRAGEMWLNDDLNTLPDEVTTLPDQALFQVWSYKAAAIQDIYRKDLSWWEINGWSGINLTDADNQVGCAVIPRFIVEKVGTVADAGKDLSIESRSKSGIDFFRVTAFSVGVDNSANVLLQTTFAKRLRQVGVGLMFAKFIQASFLSITVYLSGAVTVHAANELSISNTPLFLGTAVQPNVFFLLDDSGSMDWELLSNKHWGQIAYDTDIWRSGRFDSFSYSNSLSFVSDGGIYTTGGGSWNSRTYMFNNSNAYGNTCSRTMESCNTPRPALLDWRFRSHNLNVTFYNSDVNYKPWNGPCGSSGEACTDGDYRAALNNPKDCGTCSNQTRDLATDGDSENASFKYDVWIDDSGFTGARPLRGDNFNETGVAAGAAASPNELVDLWDTHIRFSVGATGVLVSRITYDPQTSAGASPGLNESAQTLGTLSNASACYDILGSVAAVEAVHAQGATPTIDAEDGVGCRTIAQAQTNIANWYQYSRRRMYTAKNAITQVMDAQPKFRYGVTKFKGQGSLFVEVPDVSVTNVAAHNLNLKDDMYRDKQEGIGTFLAGGLDSVGAYFSDNLGGKDNPIKHSCQKNFQIAFTDGYWNDSTNSYGDVDGDGVSNTGADIAYEYYKNDLNTSIANNVIPDAGSEDDLDADGDGRTWQHLVSFTVAFGVEGNMSDTDDSGWPNADANGTAWPGDGTPVKSGDWGNPTTCSGCPDKIDDLWHIAWNTNGTYAAASTPEEVVEKLIAAITNIAGRVGSASAVALNSGTLNTNTRVYQAKFNSIDWSGDLESIPIKDGDGDDTNDPATSTLR